jgi:hypothetical protein
MYLQELETPAEFIGNTGYKNPLGRVYHLLGKNTGFEADKGRLKSSSSLDLIQDAGIWRL